MATTAQPLQQKNALAAPEELEFVKLQAEKVKALATKDQELASQTERFKKAEQELIDDAAGAFVDGFAEALAQAAYANPRINVSSCGPLNHIVEGKIVPVEVPED